MKLDRAEMKRAARLSMRDQRPSVYAVTLLLLLLLMVLELLAVKIIFPGETLAEIAQNYQSSAQEAQLLTQSEMTMEEFLSAYTDWQEATTPSGLGRLLDVAIDIVTLLLNVGFVYFCLNVSRGAQASAGNLLDAFGIFFKVLWLNIVVSVLTMLWSLLLIVPGIVASYRYSFAIYILLDDPGKSVTECIQESKALTQGHKMELFVLELSFIGWSILSAIPFVSIYTRPYMEITRANYYCRISGRTAVQEPLYVEETEDRGD